MQEASVAALGPNLSSTLLAGPQMNHQLIGADQHLAWLRMSLCDHSIAAPSSRSLSSLASPQAMQFNAANLLHHHRHHQLNSYTNHQNSNNNNNRHRSETAQLTATSLPLTRLMFEHVLEPMQAIDQGVDYYFGHIWTKNGDERTSKLPFMSGGPWKLIYATLVYLYLIKWLLPKVMQPLKPLELNWCIRGYNLLMVLSNMYAFYHGARILGMGSKCFGCEIIKHDDYSPEALELLHYGWLFFLSRLVEWLDTIFFVLRKKERQVTKLHVFHHSFVPLITWTYLKFHPGYTVAFFPFVNSFVHTIMYTYYFLATFGPNVQPYLWWKRYLTSMQIAQFVLILIQLASIPLSSNEQCQYPRAFLYVAFAGAILFLWLFYTYYVDTYNNNKISAKQPVKTQNSNTSTQAPSKQARHVNRMFNSTPNNVREGSSSSLSDAIENAIDFEPTSTVLVGDLKRFGKKLD